MKYNMKYIYIYLYIYVRRYVVCKWTTIDGNHMERKRPLDERTEKIVRCGFLQFLLKRNSHISDKGFRWPSDFQMFW